MSQVELGESVEKGAVAKIMQFVSGMGLSKQDLPQPLQTRLEAIKSPETAAPKSRAKAAAKKRGKQPPAAANEEDEDGNNTSKKRKQKDQRDRKRKSG